MYGREFVKHPYVSPFYRKSLKDLPPILVQVSRDECLYDEIQEFSDRLMKVNANHQLQMFPDMPHVFQLFFQLGGFGEKALLQASEFIRKEGIQ